MSDVIDPTIYTSESGSGFYVTAVDGGRFWRLSGPYDAHAAAVADVNVAREIAVRQNPWAHFYSFGTALLPTREPGKCQEFGLLPPPPPHRDSLELEVAAWEGEGGR
jgi:hypothetical protein